MSKLALASFVLASLGVCACSSTSTSTVTETDAGSFDAASSDGAAPLLDAATNDDGGEFGFPVSNVPRAPTSGGGTPGAIDIVQSCSFDTVKGVFSGCGAAASAGVFGQVITGNGSIS